MPVSESYGIAIHPATRIHDTKQEVCSQPNQLNERQPKFRLPKTLHAQHLKRQKRKPEDQKVAPLRHLVAPEDQNRGNNIILVRQHCRPYNKIVPADSGAESGIDEAVAQFGEGARGWVQSGEFAEGLHDAEGDDADKAEADEQRSRAAGGEGAAGANEEARTDLCWSQRDGRQ